MANTATAYVSTYPNHEMSPTDFALLMESISLETKGKIAGVSVTNKNIYSGGIGLVSVAAGWCLVRGRIIRIDAGDVEVSLAGSGTQTKYLVLAVNLSSDENTAVFSVETSVPSDSSSFNVSNGVAYLQLASMVVGTSTIQSVTSNAVLNFASLITSKTGLLTSATVKPIIKGQFLAANVSKDNITINGPGTSGNITIDCTKSGYTAIGLAGTSITNASSSGTLASWCHFTKAELSGGAGSKSVAVNITNLHSSKKAKVRAWVKVLYVKDS